jgi:hypothetical protein
VVVPVVNPVLNVLVVVLLLHCGRLGPRHCPCHWPPISLMLTVTVAVAVVVVVAVAIVL